MKKLFGKIIKSQFPFFVLIFIFLFFFLHKQINDAYIDYGDGSYLYELKLIASGKKLYSDFFSPQPPLFYLLGYLIYFFNKSIIFIRSSLLIINIVSLYFFYLSLRKIFKNGFIALFTIISSLIFTVSIFWWPTYTGEVFLRLFISIFCYLETIKDKKINNKIVFTQSVLLSFVFFIKYSSIFFIFFYFIYLLFSNKKFFKKILLYFLINFFILNIIFVLLFGLDVYNQTILLRKILPLKPMNLALYSTLHFLIKFLPFYMVNLIIAIYYLNKKNNLAVFIFFLPLAWLPNLYFNFIEGTYLYVFYPLEPLITAGFYYLIFQTKKSHIKLIPPIKFIIYFFTFWGSLVIIYQVQIFPDFYDLRSNNLDVSTTNQIMKLIKEDKASALVAPPFFLFLTEKNSYPNFHDPFFFLYYLKNNSGVVFTHYERLKKNLLYQKPKRLFVDWRIKKILLTLDQNYLNQYKMIKSFNFLINPNETLEIFEKINR
jgi:hypothetical protein